MSKRLLVLLLLFAPVPATGSAQTVEMVFTPGVAQQALALKAALKVDKMEAFDALALVGSSLQEKKTYADKMAGVTAVVILGDAALKAAADVAFPVPVILVNAGGRTAAKNRIIRVFDTASARAFPSAKAVAGSTAATEVFRS